MDRRLFSLFLLVLLLSGCVHRHHNKPEVVVGRTTQKHSLASFSCVNVHGALNMTLHTNSSQSSLVLNGDPRDLKYAKILLQKGTLYVDLGKGYPHYGPVSLDIYTHHLDCIFYQGKGMVVGRNIRTSSLVVNIENDGKTYLDGTLNLRKLALSGKTKVQISGIKSSQLDIQADGAANIRLAGSAGVTNVHMKGKSWLSLYWVESPLVTLDLRGRSYAQLAGIVDKLNAEQWDESRFNGRYLRARRTYIRTHNKALAEITTIKSQHTVALDNSNIYFYHIPKMNVDLMVKHAAVLDMRDWRIPSLKDYGPYNQSP